MRKTFFCWGLLFAQLTAVSAAPRDLSQALQCAAEFLAGQRQESFVSSTPLRHLARAKDKGLQLQAPYYLIEIGRNQGFVVVSGSDRMKPIVGYSDHPLDEGTVPESFQYWLDCLEQQVLYQEQHPEIEAEQDQVETTPIEPLLGAIEWGQDDPYNMQCPMVSGSRSWVGCVATAVAQCVYYFRYPARGTGFCCSTGSPAISLSFDAQTYDYSKMCDNAESPTLSITSKYEMAKLCYHCGLFSNMHYGLDGSGALPKDALRGLVQYFQYDNYARYYRRSLFQDEEWNQLLVNDLQNGRPVIYDGCPKNDGLGHCFVLDGIDDKGLYHVNWGWNGYANGYYDIDILKPAGSDFSESCGAILQLAPKGKVANAIYLGELDCSFGFPNIDTRPTKLGDIFYISIMGIGNDNYYPLEGRFGIAFLQNGKVITRSLMNEVITIDGSENGGMNTVNMFQIPIRMPTDLADGEYEMHFCWENSTGAHKGETVILRLTPDFKRIFHCSIKNGQTIVTHEWDEVGIETISVNAPAVHHGSFDLMGHPVNADQKLVPGIYLIEGRKRIVR